MIYKIFPIVFFLLSSFSPREIKTTNPKRIACTSVKSAIELKVENVYNQLHSNDFLMPNLSSFSKALAGFYDLKAKGLVSKDILTLIDFSLSSNTKRLWVIDLTSNTILYQSLVAHGRNTGDEFANSFSNAAESYKSSLGFYATGEIYYGKHGTSLKLDGLEKGVNDNARTRAVVMHGADYVAESFIKNNHRLGRSLGCPALPVALTKSIINAIEGKSCLYIYHPSLDKKTATRLLS
jgi:hypothetical protein